MATTTNYSWTTPDDTGLVKDGASAIRTLGTAIDTTTKNLNPSTTLGDIEYRSSTSNTNTRVAIGSSGQALTVVAGVPSWAASPTSVLTTTGDTLYASAANTLARLGIGSTGQVLSVSGGVPAWATTSSGGMTLLSTTTLSGASTTISSISGSYTNLLVFFYGLTNATANSSNRIAPNGTTNISQGCGVGQLAGSSGGYAYDTNYILISNQYATPDRTNANNSGYLLINNYANTSSYKTYIACNSFISDAATGGAENIFGNIKTNSAITSLVFSNAGGNQSTGTVLVYGVK